MEKSDYLEGSKALEGDSYKYLNLDKSNIGLDNKRVMTKVKPNRFCVSVQQRVRSSLRYVAVIVLVLVLSYFGVHYMQINHQSLPILAKDRSEAYNVKVLPNSLSDKELNELPPETFSYLAMIDAGSSGCRAHVYRYGKLGSLDGPLYILPQHQSKKVKPGLSTFADKAQDAGASLADLVGFLKEQVPAKDWEVTPIWLKATAGLRMLPAEKAEAILDSVRAFLSDKKQTPFLFRASWARVISGNEEGGFGWIAFNYLKKIIGPKRDKTKPINPFAVIEMGGASAQVSQMAPNPAAAAQIPQEYRFSFTIEEDEFHLYTHSYLGYGAEQGREQFNRWLASSNGSTSLQHDPCKNDGLPVSQRHYHNRHLSSQSTHTVNNRRTLQTDSATPATTLVSSVAATTDVATQKHCAASVSSLFSPSSTASLGSSSTTATCSQPQPLSFGCVHQPAFVAESTNILAFENFFYLSSALGVPAVHHSHHNHNGNNSVSSFPLETTPSQIKKTSDGFCALPWDTVQTTYPKDSQPKDVNSKMCFLSGFAYAFLVDGLKLPTEKPITVQKEVDGSEIEWALGAAYKEAAGFLKRTNLRPT